MRLFPRKRQKRSFLFCFTTIIADVFYGEVSVRYLFKETPEKVERYVKMFKILVLLLIIVGSMMQLDDLWDLVDFGVAFLVLFTVYALLKMKGDVVHVLKDYLEKLKERSQAGKQKAVNLGKEEV